MITKAFIRVFVAATVCAAVVTANGAAPMRALHSDVGPTDQRINLVWVANSLTASQAPGFIAAATAANNHIFGIDPYKEYRSCFNAFAIPELWTLGAPDSSGNLTGAERARVLDLVKAQLPEVDIIFVLATPPYDPGEAVDDIAYVNGSGAQTIHELSHAFADLRDEYIPRSGLNATLDPSLASAPWAHWLSPTSRVVSYSEQLANGSSDVYAGLVGLFEGGAGQTPGGYYRSQFKCIMRSSAEPNFCVVCREAITLRIFSRKTWGSVFVPKILRPIRAFTPASSALSLAHNQSATLSVTPIQPATHSLSIQWYVDGQPISGATTPTFTYTQQGSGPHEISVRVHDTTPWVRSDPNNALKDGVFWMVNNPGIYLTSPTPGASARGGVSIEAATAPELGTIERVDFYAGRRLVGSRTTPPYRIAWSAPDGTYSLTAKAVKSVSGIGTVTAASDPVQVNIAGWNFIHVGANLPTGQGSEAYSVNDSGQVAGHIALPGGVTHAFRTTGYNPIHPSSDEIHPAGAFSSEARSINAGGEVAGHYKPSSTAPARAGRALSSATMVDLHPAGYLSSVAEGISDTGIVVGSVTPSSTTYRRAYRFAPTPMTLDAGSLEWSVASAANFTGQLAGTFTPLGAEDYPLAFRMVSGNLTMGALGMLPGDEISRAFGINDSGQVVGYSGLSGTMDRDRAIRTGSNQAITAASDLGTLGGQMSYAYGINNASQAVGTSTDAAGQFRAFFHASSMVDLNLSAPAAAWWLTEARDINNHSDVTGWGMVNGTRQAFLLKANSQTLPPAVEIVFPTPGTVIAPPVPVGNLVITAKAANSDQGNVVVEFYSNGTLLGSDNQAPYNWIWANPPPGNYQLTARAIDSAGRASTSVAAPLLINALPVVNIVSPPDETAVTTPSFQVEATASDPGGSIVSVEFFDSSWSGSSLLGTVFSPPYRLTLTGLAPGNHQIRAVATDNLGSTSAAEVSVRIIAPRWVRIMSPPDNSAYPGPSTINFSVEATAVAGIERIHLRHGTTQIGQLVPIAGSRFVGGTIPWVNAPPGLYAVTAYLEDLEGETTTYGPINIRVSAPPVVAMTTARGAYTENGPATVIDPNCTVSDSDNAHLTGATVSIQPVRANFDVLDVTLPSGISSSYNPTTCILALSGTATVADYQAALRTVTFRSIHNHPHSIARFTFRAHDGVAQSGIGYRDFNVTQVNDPPTVDFGTVQGGPLNSIPENGSLVTVYLTGISSGPQEPMAALSITATSSDPTLIPHPTVHYTTSSTTGRIEFTPVPSRHGTATITVTVNDQQAVNNLGVRTFTATVVPYTIALSVLTASAREPISGMADANGNVTVSRTGGNLSAPVNVALALSGSATPGADYTITGSGVNFTAAPASLSILLPPGVAAANLTVQPVDDTIYEGDERVDLSILPHTSYTGSGTASVTVRSVAILAPAAGHSLSFAFGVSGNHTAAGTSEGGAAVTWSLSNPESWAGLAPTLLNTPASYGEPWAWDVGESRAIGTAWKDWAVPVSFASDGANTVELPALSGASGATVAYGINNKPGAAWILGASETPSFSWHACYWYWVNGTPVVHDLGAPAGGWDQSTCYDANDLATPQIVGDAPWSSGWVPLVWMDPTAPPRILPLPGIDDTGSTRGINNSATIVGYSWYSGAAYFARPLRWNYDFLSDSHSVAYLPFPPNVPTDTQGVAVKINNSGTIAGFIVDPVNGERAVLWLNHQPIVLNDLASSTSAGINLIRAYDINNSGTVAGHALVDGALRGFLLIP